MKTRALQILDRLRIPYEVRRYIEEELTADEAARKLDLPPEMVFKTLVVRGDRSGVFLASIPATRTLSLKKAARATENKSVEMVGIDEVFRLTGYHRGGCSPLGARKRYRLLIDGSVGLLDRICISAGMRGMQMVLNPADLIRAADARVADLVE